MLGVGISAIVVGGGLITYGAIRLTQRRRNAVGRLRLAPGPTAASLSVSGRF